MINPGIMLSWLMIAVAICAAVGACMLGCVAACAIPAYAWLCVVRGVWTALATPASVHPPTKRALDVDAAVDATQPTTTPTDSTVDSGTTIPAAPGTARAPGSPVPLDCCNTIPAWAHTASPVSVLA